MVKAVGDWGFVLASAGSLAFTFIFLAAIRWWTDVLGRAIAATFVTISLIMALSTVRVVGLPLPGLMWWRAFLFPALAVTMWTSTAAFVWAQFLAHRVRRRVPSESYRKSSMERDRA